jgi:acetylxylan esterase
LAGDVGTRKSLVRDQGGDSQSIVGMVRYVLAKYSGTNMARSFATGTSSGGMMTNVLLATYPDVFAGGPASFPESPTLALLALPLGHRQSATLLATGRVKSHSAQEGSDFVCKASPNYYGERPKIAIWHGTADTLVRLQNPIESLKTMEQRLWYIILKEYYK